MKDISVSYAHTYLWRARIEEISSFHQTLNIIYFSVPEKYLIKPSVGCGHRRLLLLLASSIHRYFDKAKFHSVHNKMRATSYSSISILEYVYTIWTTGVRALMHNNMYLYIIILWILRARTLALLSSRVLVWPS